MARSKGSEAASAKPITSASPSPSTPSTVGQSGSGIAWLVVVKLFSFDWLPDWPTVLGVLGLGLALVIGFALAASLPLLRAKPAQALREL